jgi:peroxiredoxin
MLAAGSKAPLFSLIDTAGQACALQDLLQRGPVLLALYKASCPVCQMTLPYLDRIAHGVSQESSLQVVAISQDDPVLTARFQKALGLSLRTLFDRDEDGYPVSNAFGIQHVPALFLVETDGTVSLAGSGFRKSELELIGARAGVAPFRQGDHVPVWKAG